MHGSPSGQESGSQTLEHVDPQMTTATFGSISPHHSTATCQAGDLTIRSRISSRSLEWARTLPSKISVSSAAVLVTSMSTNSSLNCCRISSRRIVSLLSLGIINKIGRMKKSSRARKPYVRDHLDACAHTPGDEVVRDHEYNDTAAVVTAFRGS